MEARYEALDILTPERALFLKGEPQEPIIWRAWTPETQKLLSWGDFNEALNQGNLRTPQLTLNKDNYPLPEGAYIIGERSDDPSLSDFIDAYAVTEEYSNGTSIHIRMAGFVFKKIGWLTQKLSREILRPVTADIFATPAQSQGFTAHFDRVSSFIVQLEGTKSWEVWSPTIPNPLSGHHPSHPESLEDDEYDRIFNQPPLLSFELGPGDVLWLPRGWVHNVKSTKDDSLHVTIGIPDITPHSVLSSIADLLADDARTRLPLPFNFTDGSNTGRAEAERTLNSLKSAILELPNESIIDAFTTNLFASLPPAPARFDNKKAKLTESEMFSLRVDPLGPIRFCFEGDCVTIHMGNRELEISGRPTEIIRAVRNGVTIADIAPTDFEIIQDLISHGVLEAGEQKFNTDDE